MIREAEIETELPRHVRAFAEAYAARRPAPPAPEVLTRWGTIEAAKRDRALLALVAPIVIESDARVVEMRAGERSWTRYRALACARDDVSERKFGTRHIELMHGLHGSGGAPRSVAYPAPVAGWLERDGMRVERATEPGVTMRYAEVRPRTFVVEAGREVIVVVPEILDTPALRFMALHEFGHARAALAATSMIERAADERAAAIAARAMEQPAHAWFSPIAEAARRRRKQLAELLDAIEQGAAAPPELAKPPAALWEDPGAQSAYVAAENPL
ncbi:MAG TPA: hypothetical protein VGM88_27400 [Kofleriaceae bacterium]|jgi:hypothetical protein